MPTPPTKKRKEKDQHEEKKEPPVSPLSAFMLYANDARPRLELEYPNIKAVELSAKLVESWNDLPEEEKRIYHNRSDELQRKQGSEFGRKSHAAQRQKEEQKSKRKGPDRPEHCIIVPNGEMKLIDSPFIQKSKRRRYELPYKYPRSSEYHQPRPKPPKLNPIKKPPPPRPLIRSYPTYKERIQMMERGMFHKQAPPHIGVFKRSEDNPDLLIVDDSGQTTITFPNLEKQNGYSQGFSYGPQVPGLNGNNFFHPRIIGAGPHFAHYRLASPPVNFIPGIYSQPYQAYRYPYLPNVHGPYVQAPQIYQQAIPIPTSRTMFSEIECSPTTTGSITVRYEPLATESFENFEISDEDYLDHDPFLNLDLNEDDLQIEGDEVEFDMMGLDSDQDGQKQEEVCDDLDDINPTIAPFEEGIDQYLSVDGQPYVMIPVDMDVAKKLGWPIHMLPSVPQWLSKLTDNEVTSSGISSSELLFDSLPKLDSTSPQPQNNLILNDLDLQHETDTATETIREKMLGSQSQSPKSHFEKMDSSESNMDQDQFDIESLLRDDGNKDGPCRINVCQEEKMLPTATGEMMDCCGDSNAEFMSAIPDERGDQGRPVLTSTPNQSPGRNTAALTKLSDSEHSPVKSCHSPTCSPIESSDQGSQRRRGKQEEEAQHFKDVIRQETHFDLNGVKSVSCGSATRKPSVILESLLENSDTEMECGSGADGKREGFMEKQDCPE